MNAIIPSSNQSDICDYIEYYAFLYGECNIDIFYASDETNDEEENYKTKIRDIHKILQNRLSLYNPFSPFKIQRNKIVSCFNTIELRTNNLHYLFCLHYSLYGGSQLTRAISTLFEYIVDSALKKYLNTPYSIMTSFGENEQSIKEKIHIFLQDTKERIGDLSLIPPHAKDGGIDIITFKPLDNRGNQIIILTDATLGKNWQEKKVNSKLNHWNQYILFKTDPISCLAIAKIVPTERFHYASRDNGLLFDRARIMSNYSCQEAIQTDLEQWRSNLCVS